MKTWIVIQYPFLIFDIEKTHLALVLGVCFDVFWVLYMINLAYVMIRGYYLTKNEIVHLELK